MAVRFAQIWTNRLRSELRSKVANFGLSEPQNCSFLLVNYPPDERKGEYLDF